MIRVVVLAIWDYFTDAGLSGLGLDLACGVVLAALSMAFIPFAGRMVGLLSDCVLRGLSELFGRDAAYWIGNYATFPGVVLHEFSHAAAAKLSGAKVESMKLFSPDGTTLGQVQFTCQGKRRRELAFQRACASCAPVVGGVLFISLFHKAAVWGCGYWPLQVLSWHGALSMACHMDMSRQDMKNYLRGCVWLLPYATAVFTVVAYAVGHSTA